MSRTVMSRLAAGFILAALWAGPAPAADTAPDNALLVVPSDRTAFDRKFQAFLYKRGAKLTRSFPPSVFIGYIPKDLDAELERVYGAEVYRDKVDDWSSFARYGENAVFAVNAWNKRFVEDPPAAPLVVSAKVQSAGRKSAGIRLTWNEVMRAAGYRLQISTDKAFGSLALETVTARNDYRILPAFWADGVYYWRVAGLLRLPDGGAREGDFSEPYSFAVSKPSPAKGAGPARQKLPASVRVKGRPLAWPGDAAYYRLQISETADFSAPLVDVFTDTCSYKLSGLPLKRGAPYYMRVMPSDGASAGDWSAPAELVVENPPPIARDVRRRTRR